MTAPVDIRADHLRIVRDVLRQHLPAGVKVWVFGSRATWKTKDSSDLDLALEGSTEIPSGCLAALETAFEESDLPFVVDVVDINRIGEHFGRIVSQQRVVLVPSHDDRERQGGSFTRINRHATRCESSSAPADWQEARLGDVVRLVSGGTPSKGRAAYWDGEIPWVSARDMKKFRLRDTSHHVTAEGLANGTRQVPAGTVLLLTRGMRLLKELPVCVTERPMAFNQDIKALLVRARLEPSFLPYLVVGSERRLLNLVDLAGHGTGRINSDELRALDVRLPPTCEQRAIAHILGTLDDKIELNRRMNETLEAMARALFKSWFVDFDPVRAKMEGRDTGLPQDIADLFSDRLVDSEMGEIPEGWRASTLADVALLNPESWSNRNAPDSIRYVDLANTKWGYIDDIREYTWAEAPSRSRRVLRRGDTIVGTVRPGNGSFALIDRDSLTGSTGFAVLRPRSATEREIVWCAATSEDSIKRLSHLADGGAYPAVSPGAVLDTLVVLPDERLRRAFSSLAAPLLNRAQANRRDAHVLAAVRDTLLPQLMSGEIRWAAGGGAIGGVT